MPSSVQVSLTFEVPGEVLEDQKFADLIEVQLVLFIKVSFLSLILEGLQHDIVISPEVLPIVQVSIWIHEQHIVAEVALYVLLVAQHLLVLSERAGDI